MSTTTTSYVELTDAQMLDYAVDADFTMHAGGSSPAWLTSTVEATMSDETNSMQEAVLEDYNDTIEVDMEPHVEDEEMTEYEMADEGTDDRHDLNQDTEVVDIEVLEPSRAATPTVTSFLETPVAASQAVVQPPTLTGNFDQLAPAITNTVEETIPDASLAEKSLGGSDSSPDFQHVQAQSPLHHPVVAEGVLSEMPAALDISHDAGTTLVVPAPADASNFDDSVQSLTGAPAEEHADSPAALLHDEETKEDIEASVIEEPPVHEADAQQEPEAGAEDENHEASEEIGYEAHTSNGEDPHEISAGVYIDPPPAVLMSISFPAGSQDFCLFNQPYVPSGSQSPNEYASTSTASDLTLLLHERPTLYYEPLSNVFDALRQEEAIYNAPELAEGELILDAYDLDLKIGEDNIYAREVTIHELNVVHDGIDLRGPLRLRLSVSSPRFITRYHTLRDQISQLTLELNGEVSGYAEEEFPHEELTEEGGEYEVGQDEGPTEAGNPHEEVTDQEYNPDYDYEQALAGPEDLHNEQPVEFEHPDQSAEEVVGSPAPEEVHETGDLEADAGDVNYEVEGPGESHDEYGTEATAEVEEGLDADEVHRYADAEEGGDYTDYTQNADGEQHDGEDSAEEIAHDVASEVQSSGGNYALGVNHDDVLGGAERVDVTYEPERGTEESEATYDEPKDSPVVQETYEGGEVLDNHVSGHDGTSPQIRADYDKTADFADVEQLEEYDEPDAIEALNHVETSQHDDWEDDIEDQLESKDSRASDDASSKRSSETLSSARSKRAREEDDEDDVESYRSLSVSPESKRARVH